MRGVLLALLLVSPAPAAKPKEAPPAVPVAKVSYREGTLEESSEGESWKRVDEGYRVRTGDRLRTGPGATARIEFPWMSMIVGPRSVFSVAPSTVLSTVLELGRVEQHAEGGDIIKLRTAEAEIRGGGRVVVRREGDTTQVSVLEGRFRVEAGGKTVALARGQGTAVPRGWPPSAVAPLADAPTGQQPGVDPQYVPRGEAAALNWTSSAASHHVQILGLGSDEVLIERDLASPPVAIEIPWLGTFRWRVSARDERGLEGVPSADGFVCVVEK